MKAISFKQANNRWERPKDISPDQCSHIFTHSADNTHVSCWTTSFWERLKFLFHGKIWLGVLSGEKLPPVFMDCQKSVFEAADSHEVIDRID